MRFWEYRPQTYAVIPDACIFVTAGMNLAIGLGFNYFHFRISWFIAAIVGVLLSPPLMKFFPKRYFALLSSALVVVAGILSTVWPDDEIKSLVARYLNGFGVGLIIVPFIVHSSETIVSRRRGFALGIEQLAIAVGVLIQLISSDSWHWNSAFGVFCLGFGLIALGMTFAVIESPIWHIRHGNNAAALDVLTRLELPAELTNEKKQLLEEHKNYIFQNEFHGINGSFTRGLGPLLRMFLYRLVMVLTFCRPYNIELTWGLESPWPLYLAGVLRVLGVLGGMTMLEPIGRKIISSIGLLAMGGVSIGVAVLFKSNYYDMTDVSVNVVCVLLVLMQFFAGLYAPTSTTYLSEAFPMLVKPFFIAFCVCLEFCAQIVLIFAFRYNIYAITEFNIFASTYFLVCFVLFVITIPETKWTSLSEAQDRFHKWMHLKSW